MKIETKTQTIEFTIEEMHSFTVSRKRRIVSRAGERAIKSQGRMLRCVSNIAQATPPSPVSKLTPSEYDLREGFRIGTKPYVVGTDVYGFVIDGSLTVIRKKLQDLVEDAKPAAKRST